MAHTWPEDDPPASEENDPGGAAQNDEMKDNGDDTWYMDGEGDNDQTWIEQNYQYVIIIVAATFLLVLIGGVSIYYWKKKNRGRLNEMAIKESQSRSIEIDEIKITETEISTEIR